MNYFKKHSLKLNVPFLLLMIFCLIGGGVSYYFKNVFYVLNFTYIGGCICIALVLLLNGCRIGRRVSQIGIGLYMLVYLGFVRNENMQIEGFWYYLFLGIPQVALLHYIVAKIIGPILWGRGWCGYACWTAAVLDLLPYKVSKAERNNKLGIIKYIYFGMSICFVGAMFILKVYDIENILGRCFIIGNIIYYALGIVLAFVLKDNRAFCKYICPIVVFLKPMSYFSVMRIKVDGDKCIKCNKCKNKCPMNVDILDNSRQRKNGTECILCFECINNCPKKAVHL